METTGKKSRLSEAELSQPCCTALQVALVILLAKYGIHPDAVVGHSSGEIAAAFASGLITADEAMLVAYYRGQAVAKLDVASHPGAMAAVGLSPEATVPYLVPGAVVGCENSPHSTTITGDAAAVKSVMQAIKNDNPDVLVRELRVDRAYHSRKLSQNPIHIKFCLLLWTLWVTQTRLQVTYCASLADFCGPRPAMQNIWTKSRRYIMKT